MNITDIFPDLRGTGAPKLPKAVREPSHTKSGPGRKHVTGDWKKTTKQKQAGRFGRGLRNLFARLAAARYAKRAASHSKASHAKRGY